MAGKLLSQRLKELDKLTPSEIKIVDYFLRHLDLLALENITTLSQSIKVSKATIVRFIARMGYDGFAELHQELKSNTRSLYQSLSTRYTLKRKEIQTGDILSDNMAAIIQNLQHNFDIIDVEKIEQSARMIAEVPGTLYITGQRSSYALAMLFHLMIRRIRPEAKLMDARIQTEPEGIQYVGPSDLLVCIFRHPYTKLTRDIASFFQTCGAAVILVTDTEQPPITKMADVVLAVTSEGLSIFNSFTAVTALLELIHHFALHYCDQPLDKRLDATEALYNQFDVFCRPVSLKHK